MNVNFFIERPIFSAVMSIIIVVVGLVAMITLPIAQFPDIAPPTVQIDADYPGASAEVAAEAVARRKSGGESAAVGDHLTGGEQLVQQTCQARTGKAPDAEPAADAEPGDAVGVVELIVRQGHVDLGNARGQSFRGRADAAVVNERRHPG